MLQYCCYEALYPARALLLFPQGINTSPQPNNPAAAQQKANISGQKSGNAKPIPLETKGQATPNSANQNPKHTAPANEPDNVRVISVPEITVARDKPAFYVSLALAIVGIIGIVVAIATLIIVRRQTKATEKAAKASAESVAAINRQIEVMERQTIATEKAAEATAQSVVLATDTAKRQLRAYLCVSSAILRFYDSNLIGMEVHIRNSGQTPAYSVRQWVKMVVEKYPLANPVPDPPPELRMASAIIGPGDESIFKGNQQIATPAPNVVLGTLVRTVFVTGKVTYKDAFGEDRFTKYRLMYGGPEGGHPEPGKDGSAIGRLQPDTEGNEAN